jgi:hydrogenase maturation protease
VAPVTVLVCGEPLRGDDAIGPRVAEALSERVRRRAEVRQVGGLMPDDLLQRAGPVIVVDAVRGLPPGSVVDVPLRDVTRLEASGAGPASSHALPLASVVAIAEHLEGGRLLGRFIGIGAGSFELGSPMSPPVEAAVRPAAAKIASWIRVLAHREGPSPCA